MSLCASCGFELPATDICPHHFANPGDDWAAANRVYCDFFHRGIVPSRLAEPDRADDFWAYADPGML